MRPFVSVLALLVLPLFAETATLGAQEFADDEDTADARREQLQRIIEAALKSSRARPSVLGDVDVRRAAPHDLRVIRSLRRRYSIDFRKQSFPDVITAFRQLTDVTFVLTAKATEWVEEQAAAEQTFSMNFRRLKVENMLNLFARKVPLRFTVRDGAIVVVHKSEFLRGLTMSCTL